MRDLPLRLNATLGNVGGQALSTLTLRFVDGTDFAAGILCKKFVEHASFGKVKRKQQKSSIHAGLRRDGSRSDSSLSDGQGAEKQSHSCFHGRMAVTAVILPFFVPAAFNEEEHEHGRTEKHSKAQNKNLCSRAGG
jgi:hypothetical protein